MDHTWKRTGSFALTCLLLGGCSTADEMHDSFRADLVLIGRIVSSHQVGIARAPDYIEYRAQYELQPLDQPSSKIEAIGICPPTKLDDQTYLVFLNKRRPAREEVPEHRDVWEMVGCVRVDDQNSVGLLKRLPDF
jgi:hypothetical protein